MKQVILQIPEDKVPLFIEFAKNISFIKKINVEDELDSKTDIVNGVKQAVKEMNLVKAGKLKARDARELINEL